MRSAYFVLAASACGARTELPGGATPAEAGASDLTPDFAWYRLDETSGTTAHDSSPNHYDITNLGGVTWGDGAMFDGASVCGSTDVAPAFRTPPITLTAWLTPAARHDQTSTSYGLAPFPPDALSGDVPGLGGYGIGLDVWTDGIPGSALAAETGKGPAAAYHSLTGSFAVGVRHLAAVVVGDASAAVYLDGSLLQTVSANSPPSTQPVPLHLGCHNDDTGYGSKRFYDGRMRDARVYRRALDAGEIATLYANGPV